MIDWLLFGATFLAALGSGLIGGVFFGFAAFMLKAISRLPEPQAIATMQAITRSIRNSLFLVVFLATAAWPQGSLLPRCPGPARPLY